MTSHLPSLAPSHGSKPSLTDCLLAGKFKEFIQYVAYVFQVLEDMVLINVLGAVNSALNGKLSIRHGHSYWEVVQLFLLWLAGPGERKTSIVKLTTGPLFYWQEQHDVCLYFGDASGSALIKELADNNGRLCCHESEPTLLGAVRKGILPPSTLCKCYDAEPISLHRARKKPLHLNDPAISLCIGTQPKFAYEFGRHRDVRASGLLARFLPVTFPSLLGSRLVNTPPVPAEALELYDRLITRLLEFVPPLGKRHLLSLDAAAEARFMEFAQQVEWELAPHGLLNFDKEWGGKLVGKILRLAALLHCVFHEQPWDIPIGLDTVNQAIAMADVFVDHAQQFFFQVEHGEVLEVAHAIEAWAATLGPFTTFTVQDAKNALPAHPPRMVSAGVLMLVENGVAYEDLGYYAARARRGRPKGPRYRLSGAAWRYTP